MRPIALFGLLLSTTAGAVPLEMHHQGRLFDQLGAPLDGPHDLTITLYDDASGTTSLWTDTYSTTIDNGYFEVRLGTGSTPLDSAVFDGSLLWVGMAIDSAAELPGRLPLASVPYAFRADFADAATTADTATNLDGGTVDATEIRINGTTVIDSTGAITNSSFDWAALTGIPSDLADGDAFEANTDLLASVGGCSDGQLLTWQTGAWTCGAAMPTSIPWSMLTGVPAGLDDGDDDTDTDTLATLGCSDGNVARFVGSSWACAAPGDGLQIGDSTLPCDDASQEGTLRYRAGALEVCTDTGWTAAAGGEPTGASAADAALSCQALLSAYPGTTSGTYWLDPDGGSSANAFQAHCEMTQNGGGWVRCAGFRNSNPSGANGFTFTSTEWNKGVIDYSSSGNFCMSYPHSELFGEAWNDSSALQLRTSAISVPSDVWTAPKAVTAYGTSGDCIGVKHTASHTLTQTGGAACGVLNNGLGQGSGISVSNGGQWRGMHGNLNNGTSPQLRMCDANTWCGGGNGSAALYLYAR